MNKGLAAFYAGQAMRSDVEGSHFLAVQLAHIEQAVAGGDIDHVLDIGAGGGASTVSAQSVLPSACFTGLDISTAANDWYRKRTGAAALLASLDNDLPVADANVDAVICDDVIEHLVDPDHAAREMRRVLRPGGHLFLTTPNLAAWFNRVLLLFGAQPLFSEVSLEKVFGRMGTDIVGHLRLYTKRALRQFLEYHGFEIVRLDGAGFDATPRFLQPLDRTIARAPGPAAILVCWARRPQGHG